MLSTSPSSYTRTDYLPSSKLKPEEVAGAFYLLLFLLEADMRDGVAVECEMRVTKGRHML
ncbi:hypothetical protein E2C01_007742 [Portunus trituberculatus]|uniref:Uncharacterized protein n=1 Tax=Portunus trituberculatus TaxID=210409 RepID=A0A5B7CYZ3_PORTR|nr:hypothetical protein [Portunus trituberculatus]